MTYPRDLVGYGRTPPDPKWPNRARLALQIVMNYEEGGERSILHGDAEADRKSTRLNSSHLGISYAVFCLKKKNLLIDEDREDDEVPSPHQCRGCEHGK